MPGGGDRTGFPKKEKMSKSKKTSRVFVLGAGASRACGIPLAGELLRTIIEENHLRKKSRVLELLRYLYPRFDARWGNYPNIEEFLSLLESTITFNDKVKTSHKFQTAEIEGLRDDVLMGIAARLLRDDPTQVVLGTPLLSLAALLRPSDVVVTFNWDLLLEAALFSSGTENWSYRGSTSKLTILKPHGSVDWYDSSKVTFKGGRSYPLIPKLGNICVYQYFQSPSLKKPVLPIIIPPTFAKEWTKYPEFDRLWHSAWHSLRYADEIYVVGFSLPPEDLHVRFVMRSALRANEANRSTQLKLKFVNPEPLAHLRFTHLVDSPVEYFQCGFEKLSLDELTENK
jgi:hypothetical protein